LQPAAAAVAAATATATAAAPQGSRRQAAPCREGSRWQLRGRDMAVERRGGGGRLGWAGHSSSSNECVGREQHMKLRSSVMCVIPEWLHVQGSSACTRALGNRAGRQATQQCTTTEVRTHVGGGARVAAQALHALHGAAPLPAAGIACVVSMMNGPQHV
jgi:hypothetical protein